MTMSWSYMETNLKKKKKLDTNEKNLIKKGSLYIISFFEGK